MSACLFGTTATHTGYFCPVDTFKRTSESALSTQWPGASEVDYEVSLIVADN